MLTGPAIILTLKVLVTAVTVLFAASLAAVLTGRVWLHGRINTAFFVLTMMTVVGFELLLRLGTDVTATFSPEARKALTVHLYFAVPAVVVLAAQFATGWLRWRRVHVPLGIAFTVLWAGTFVTGVFFLPHGG